VYRFALDTGSVADLDDVGVNVWVYLCSMPRGLRDPELHRGDERL